MRTAKRALLLALALLGCARPPMTASAGTTVTGIANPEFIVANGGVSVITALLIEPAGTLVPDGTVVLFFTNLGRIDAQVKTRDGIARANLVADARSGVATVLIVSGGPAPAASPGNGSGAATGTGSAQVEVRIGSALPELVVVSADPQRILSPRSSHLTANVFDANGNPVANVPVIFSVSATPLEETLDSGGGQRFTNTNGQAFDTLRTRAAAGGVQKTVTVRAVTANGVEGTTTVAVN